jgi:hypothetical protein
MANIAIVTSTAFGGSSRRCFQAGLAAAFTGQAQPAIVGPFESHGVYDLIELRRLIRSAADAKPDLIVAAGGLVTAQAAAWELQEQDAKFIFVSSETLAVTPASLAGGVDMNSPGEHDALNAFLKKQYPSVRDESIYLVVNDNDPTWPNDAKDWPSSRVARFFCGVANPKANTQDTTDDNHFVAEFRHLAERRPTPTGLVIASDPYFVYFRSAFAIALAAELPVPVCYPFREFVDASAKVGNKDNSIALDRPPLNNPSNDADETTAYFQLGKQAARFLTGTANVGIVRWSGSAWTLDSSGPARPSLHDTRGMEIEVRVKGWVDETRLQDVLAILRGMR